MFSVISAELDTDIDVCLDKFVRSRDIISYLFTRTLNFLFPYRYKNAQITSTALLEISRIFEAIFGRHARFTLGLTYYGGRTRLMRGRSDVQACKTRERRSTQACHPKRPSYPGTERSVTHIQSLMRTGQTTWTPRESSSYTLALIFEITAIARDYSRANFGRDFRLSRERDPETSWTESAQSSNRPRH